MLIWIQHLAYKLNYHHLKKKIHSTPKYNFKARQEIDTGTTLSLSFITFSTPIVLFVWCFMVSTKFSIIGVIFISYDDWMKLLCHKISNYDCNCQGEQYWKHRMRRSENSNQSHYTHKRPYCWHRDPEWCYLMKGNRVRKKKN